MQCKMQQIGFTIQLVLNSLYFISALSFYPFLVSALSVVLQSHPILKSGSGCNVLCFFPSFFKRRNRKTSTIVKLSIYNVLLELLFHMSASSGIYLRSSFVPLFSLACAFVLCVSFRVVR